MQKGQKRRQKRQARSKYWRIAGARKISFLEVAGKIILLDRYINPIIFPGLL
jgi:hypothetical protein